MQSAAVAVAGLGKRFGLQVALENVDLVVPPGQFVSLFGPNGAGKTTLIRCLATLTRPTAGEIRILGSRLDTGATEVRRHVGVVSHSSFLYGALTARENLQFYARMFGVADPFESADRALQGVGLVDRADDPVRGFSRGMLQRCAIARALVHDPAILLLDEPFSGLDPVAADSLHRLLREAHARARTVLMTSHDLQRGHDLADRVLILDRGSVGLDLPAEDIDRATLATQYQTVIRGTR